MRMRTSARVCMGINVCPYGYIRAYMYVRDFVRVSVRLVCVCMNTSVTILMSYF